MLNIVIQNAALQSQVMQLQEDIEKDTKLRKELVERLEHAKADLNKELTNLDQSLKVIIWNDIFANLFSSFHYHLSRYIE